MKTNPPPANHCFRAFTLIELLTVIAIIGILAAIIIPTVGKVRESARAVQCKANLRSFATAGLMWIQDHKDSMCDSSRWQSPDGRPGSAESYDWSFLPYVGYKYTNEGGTNPQPEMPTPISCPSSFRDVGSRHYWARGYSINVYACKQGGGDGSSSPYTRHAKTLSEIVQPSVMAFLMDAYFLANNTPQSNVNNATMTVWKERGVAGLYAGHGGKTNVAFLDGHIKAMSPTKDFPVEADDTARRKAPFWGSLQ